MRQSSTRKTPLGNDAKRTRDVWLRPGRTQVVSDPYGPVAATRRGHLEQVVAQLQANGRAPRVCLYALSIGGQRPRASLEAASAYAVRQAWQVGEGRAYTDHPGDQELASRPGWRSVREQVRAGYADGVVVVTASVVSSHVDEYQREIDWFGRHWGFIGLVIPEMRKAQR